jgi:molybdopterin molybdotransferase
MEMMISVEEALKFIEENVKPLEPVLKKLEEACDLVVVNDTYSPLDIPAFPQSSMDGYAFAFEEGITNYSIAGEIPAGFETITTLAKGTAARIFTGAPVPLGADTVVMQEKTIITPGIVSITDEKLQKGANVRLVGTEMRKGQLALGEGSKLNPVSIGLLAGLGIDSVLVYPKPRVGIIITGNELQKPGEPLAYGQVYDSNSYSLRAALHQLGIEEIQLLQSNDDVDKLSTQLNDLLENSDLVLLVGGVSVGDYDFTLPAFEKCGVEPIFHKIKQKPGKPLLFGKKENVIVFGLPGNPASVMTCFYEYLLPAIGKMTSSNISVKSVEAKLEEGYAKPNGLTCFLKAYYNGQTVRIQTGQESYKLSSFAEANCLAVLPEKSTEVKAGEVVKVHLLPHSI